MRRFLSAITLSVLVALVIPAVAYAHVVVTPAEAGVGSRSTFSVSVPNEKDIDVTGLKLSLPGGLKDVQATVHPGWTITVSKDTGGNVAEITWSQGSIPPGQRDDFSFQAQVPAKATSLTWRAYQTYADGTTVSWDQAPTKGEEAESETSGPASVTKVVNDLAAGTSASKTAAPAKTSTLPLALSLVALVLSIIALSRKHD